MPKMTRAEAKAAALIIEEGMGVEVSALTNREKREVCQVVHDLVQEGHEPRDLVLAAKYGMRHVWPFTEQNVWDAEDFRKNITKAKLAALKMKKRGDIPTSAALIPKRGRHATADEDRDKGSR